MFDNFKMRFYYRKTSLSLRPSRFCLQSHTDSTICKRSQGSRRPVHWSVLRKRVSLHPGGCGGIWQTTTSQRILAKHVGTFYLWGQRTREGISCYNTSAEHVELLMNKIWFFYHVFIFSRILLNTVK